MREPTLGTITLARVIYILAQRVKPEPPPPRDEGDQHPKWVNGIPWEVLVRK